MANKNPVYRRLNALGFLCSLSALIYIVLSLQTGTTDLISPLSSLIRLIILICTGLFFIALIHNPGVSGQRFYSFINLLVVCSGLGAAVYHLWVQSQPEQIDGSLQNMCQLPFEQLMATQQSIVGKLELLFSLSSNCTAEALPAIPIGFAEQSLFLFLMLFLLCWKMLLKKERPEGLFL